MFCPECRAEYRPGTRECSDCHVALVERLVPEEHPTPAAEVELTAVFRADNPALLAVAASLLEAAGIPFMARGEGLQDLLGWGRFPGGMNLVSGPVEFRVGPEDVERAAALLEEIDPGGNGEDEDDNQEKSE